MLEQITAEDFERLIGQIVCLEWDAHRLPVEVDSVRRLSAPSPRPQPPFSVILRDPESAVVLAQGTYRFEHPQHGLLELFVVPIGPLGKQMCYEITFN